MFLTPWLRSVRSRLRKSNHRIRRSSSQSSQPVQNRLEALEDRTLLSTITWTNRGNTGNDTDLFNDTFGVNANAARAVVDGVIQQWEDIIVDWNRPTFGNNIDVVINMSAGGTGFGGSAGTGFDGNGYPISGGVTLLRGNDITGDGVGDGDGWFLDPTPLDNVEFDGSIQHAFSANASGGSPANGTFDFYTLFNLELTHVLGITSSAAGLIQNPLSGQVVDTGIADNAEGGGIGNYFVFDGPSVTHLMTSNNGGAGGSDFGTLVHSAGPNDAAQPIAFNSLFRGTVDLRGAEDHGNAIFEFNRRYGNADYLALIIQDAYGATIATPTSLQGNFYQQLDTATGELIIRGGQNGLSDDVISITRSGADLIVSTDIGNDTPGTGPNGDASDIPAYVTTFTVAQVNSIRIEAGDGDDSITLDGSVIPAGGGTIDGGAGTNTLTVTGTANAVTHGFGLPNEGSIGIDGNSLTFTALDMVTDTLVAPMKTLQFSAIDDTVTLDDDGDLLNGLNRVTSPGSGTIVDFVDATSTLTVLFGDGNDTWNYVGQDPAAAAAITLNGEAGTDTIDATIMPTGVVLIGGDDADTLTGTDFDDTISGNDGDDEIDGLLGTDLLVETSDVDFTLTDTSLTGLGTDMLTSIELAQLTGGASDNTIDASAFTGQTTLLGLAGGDTLTGGTDSDSLSGGTGDDEVNGGAGDDILLNEIGDDSLNGDAGDDIISAGTGDDVVMGGADNDEITVTYVGGNVTVDAGLGSDIVLVDDSGLGLAGSVDIDGGDGIDSFYAAPLLGGTLDFHGNTPVFGSFPGDVLTVFLLDPAITSPMITDNVNGGTLDGTGSVTSTSHGDMNWDGIEGLNLLNDPDLVLDANLGLPFGVDGADSGVADSFRLFRTGNFGQLELDGTIVFTFPVTFLTSITVNGSTDDDTLTVDLSTGAIPVPITFNGLTAASDNDRLRVIGSDTEDTLYVPSTTTFGDGVLTIDGNDLTFTDLEPVELTNMASFTLQTPNSQDDISLTAARNFANTDDALLISGTSGGIGIESVRLLDVVDVTIDLAAADGALSNDMVTIGNGALLFDPTDMLTDITILAGQGNDTFEIQDSEFQLPGGGTLSLDGGVATDTIRVTAQDDAAELDVALTLVTAGPDAMLTSTAGLAPATIQLLNFSGEIAALTGNSSDNLIDLSGWSVNNQQSTATVVGGSSGDDLLDGDDTLIGFNDDTVWTITNAFGPDSGDATGIHFENIDNLVGGSGNDTFTLQNGVTFSGTVDGGSGTDQLNLSDLTTAQTVTLTASTLNGFDGTSSVVTGGFFGIDEAIGSLAITDSLQGLDVNSTWELDGSNRYIDNLGRVLTFSAFEELQGGSADDVFQVTGTRSNDLLGGDGDDTFIFQLAFSQVVGRVDGEAGSDTLNLAALTTPRVVTLTSTTVDGFSGTEASITADFAGIDAIVGGFANNDTLNGLATDSRWNINGPNQGTYTESPTARVLAFSQIENLNGNDGVDTFDFDNSATLTGSLSGGNGFDALIGDDSRASETFIINGVNSGQFVTPAGLIIGGTFSDVETLIGAQGQDTFQFTNSGSLAGLIDGVGGTDEIVGDNDGNAFTVSNNDAGDLPDKINTAGLGVTGFINVEDLTGGAGVDTFIVNSLLVGDIDGRSGNDQFFFGPTGSIGGTLIGGPGFDTLTGDDDGNLFNIEGNGALSAIGKGTLVTKTSEFRDIETLVGGAGPDTFSFNRLGSIIGTVDGAGGDNTLVGDDDGNNFTVSQTNAGLLSGKMTAFTNIQNLEGGAANDTFNINSTLDGNVSAFVGDDSIIINTLGVVGGNVDAGALDDFIEIRGRVIGNVDGGSQNDTIVFQNGSIVDGTVSGNAGDDLFSIRGVATLGNTLMGDAGNDTFEFFNGGSINVMIDGGADSDTIVGDDDGNVFTITGPDSGSLPDKVPAGYTSIENLTGGSGVDIFNINADLAGSLSGLGGDDQFVVAPGQTVGGDINGDSGNDTFTVGDGAMVDGTISGGADDDILIVDYTGASTRTLTFDGGSDDDLLRLTGTVVGGTTTYSVGPTADAGTVVTNGVGQQTITFTGLEPIEDLMTLASLIINASLGADIINISDAPTSGRTEVNFNGAFELYRFEGKTDVTVNGGAGNDTININNPNPANGLSTLSVDGEADNDTINVLENHAGDLTGGTGNDSFVFSNSVQLTGTVDGEDGTDTINALAVTTSLTFDLTSADATGFAGTEATLLTGAGTFDRIDSIRGGAGVDQLNGLDVDSTWGVDGTNTYTDDMARVLAFSLLETLNGGSMADTFNVTGFQSATLNGGAGDDQLNMTANGAFLNGPFDGEAGTDTVSLAGLTSGQSVTLTANGAVDGFDGSTSTIIGGFQNVDSVTGSAGTDTITGMDVVAIWEIDGTNTFEDDPTNRMLAFSAFENLQGGGLSDRFNITGAQTNNILGGVGDDIIAFADLATLTGTINGESGSDIVDYSQYVSGGVTATVGDFTSIEQIIGGMTALDSIIGGSGNDVFAVTDMNEGTINGIGFSAFENLDGRDGNDSFDFQTSGNLSGSVEGGNGSDSLTVSRPGLLTVNITGPGVDTANAIGNGVAGNETAIVGGFNNINSITATGSDVLNGADADSTWNLDTTSSYTVGGQSATFAGFATLNGGTQADTFNVNSSVSFDVNGGAGDDSINLAASVTLSGDVFGGNDMDTLSIATGATLNGAFDGEADSDTVTFALSTSPVTIDLLAGSATGFSGSVSSITNDFSNVDSLIGSSVTGDTLNGLDVNSVWTLDTPNTYSDMTDSVEFASFETLNGGTQDDTFNILTAETASLFGNNGNDSFIFQDDAASLTGGVSGGPGNNSLSFAGLTTVAATVTLTGNGGDGFAGAAGSMITSGFAEIFTLTGGGSASDTLTGQNVSSTWEVNPAGDTYRDDSTGRILDFSAFDNLTGGTLDDSFTVDALATLGGSISDLGGGDVVTVASDGLGAGGSVVGGISTGIDGDIVRIEDDATVGGLIDTGAGDDLVEIAFDGGTTRTLNLAMGSGDDNIQLDGSDPTAIVDYTVGPGSDQGTLVTTIGGDMQTVSFSGMNPADDDVLIDRQDGAEIHINGSTSADVITVQDGLQNITFFTEVDFNNAFPNIQFQNKTQAVINGGSNADTFNLNNLMPATGLTLTNIEGGDGNDIINVLVNHTGDLNGGAGNDSFIFSDGIMAFGETSNVVNGGSGTDTIDVSAYSTDVLVTLNSDNTDGFTGELPTIIDAPAPPGLFTGIDNIIAGTGANDSLTGLDTTATWQLDGSSTYTDTGTASFRSLSFGNFEELIGNGMADTFDITGPQTVGLDGREGDDTFRFLNDTAAIDGFVLGDTGTDTLDFSAFSTSTTVSVTLDAAGFASGFDGNVSQVSMGFTDIDSIVAGDSSSDSLTGINAIGAWVVDEPGSYSANAESLAFSLFENLNGNDGADIFLIQDGGFNLTGGDGDDTFNVTDGVALTGTIDGGDHGAGDTLSFALSTSSIAFPVGLVTNVETINGSGTGDDTVLGTDGDDVFEIDGADSGTVNGAMFNGFANLDGGLGNDSFQFTANAPASLSGSIEGGGGTDTLGFNGVTTGVDIDLSGAGGTDGFNGNETGGALNGFQNIDVLQGSLGATDTLTGLDLNSTWTLGATSTYAAAGSSVDFTLDTANGFENLVGQSMDDVFNVSGSRTANIAAADGADELNLAAGAMLTGSVTTGADNDLFTFGTGAMLVGPLDAGTEQDTLDFSSSSTDVAIQLRSANAAGGFNGDAPALITTAAAVAESFNSTATLTFTAVETGTSGNAITVTVDKNDQGAAGLPVVMVAGNAITITLNTNGTNESTAQDVIDAVAMDAMASALIGVTLTAGVGTTDITTPANPVTNLMLAGGQDGFAGINDILGGSGMNRLTGLDTDSTWTIGVTNTYEEDSDPANVLDFSSIGSAIGGAGVDSFDVTSSTSLSLSGGDGADTFDVAGSADVTGSLNGDAGDDVFTFAGAAIVPALLDGGADNDAVDFSASITAVSINLDSFTNVEMVTGTSISDSIVGSTGHDDFNVTSNDNGTVLSGVTAVTTTFVDFENLAGGAGNDDFVIDDTFGVSGAIDGGADNDTIDYSGYTSGVTVNLATGAATNIAGGITGLENIIGGSMADALTGDAGNNTLTGNGGDDTLADGLGDDSLDGGADNDTYLLTPGSADTLTDAGGIETLDFSGASAGVTIDLDIDTAQDVFGGNTVTLSTGSTFENFVGSGFADSVSALVLAGLNRSLAGGGGSDTFATSDNSATNQFDITSDDAGTFGTGGVDVVNFSSFENLTGGSDDDDFVFEDGDTITGTIDGGMGGDTLDYLAYTAGNSVNLELARVISIEDAFGGAGSDTITGDNVATMFNVNGSDSGNVDGTLMFQFFENLTGGSADDTFTFGTAGTLSGGIDGGDSASANSLVLSDDIDVVTLTTLSPTTGFSGNVEDDTMAAVTSFANINSVDSGMGDDELAGLNASSTWTLNDAATDLYQSGGRSLTIDNFETYSGGSSTDNFTINGAQGIDLNGGAGNDLFAFATGASTTAGTVIDGGSETDTLDFVNGAPVETIALSAVMAGTGFSGVTGNVNLFNGIDAIDGTGGDSLSAIPGTAATIDLNTVGNTLQSGGESLAFSGVVSLTGSNLDDVINVTGVHAVDINAGAGNDQIVILTNSSDITGTIDGGSQTTQDVLDLSNLSLGRIVDSALLNDIESVIGTSGNDTLIGNAAGSAFQVTGASNAGNLDVTLAFSSVETLLGGAGPDSFAIDDTLTIGAVIGGTGTDTLDLSDYTSARSVQLTAVVASNGFTGSESAVNTFTGIDTITASATAGEEITGLNADATFTLNGTPTSTYATGGETLTLNGFEVFTGNAGRDRFDVTDNQTATANGGAGDDTLAIDNGFTFTGLFTGGLGVDTVDLSDYATTLAFTIDGLGTTDGFLVNAAPLSVAANDVNAIVGGMDVDMVTGLDLDSNWTLGATDTYTSTNSLSISDVEIRFGGTGVDTFDIQANELPVAGHQILGDAGNDVFNVNFAAGTGLASGASLGIAGETPAGDAGNPDTVNFNVNSLGDGARAVTLEYQPTASGDLNVTLDGDLVTLVQIEAFNLAGDSNNDDSVSVIGTTNADDLTVTPTANGATVLHDGGVAGGGDGPDISISGLSQTGLQLNGAGSSSDALTYNGSGATVTVTGPFSGTITQSGVADVNFLSIEDLNTSQPAAYIVDAQGDADDASADAFLVELNGSGIVEVSVNGSFLLVEDPNNINGLFINGSSDDDTLTVDFTSGDPIPTDLLFNGGSGTDDLISIGGMSGVYTPSASIPGNGVLTIDGSAITFAGLEPVTASMLDDLTFITPGDADVISVTSPGLGQNLVSGTSGGVAFESLQFSSVGDFILDAATNSAGGADSITVGDISGVGLNSFTVNTGSGADTVDAGGVMAVDLTISTGSGNDVITSGLGNDTIDGGSGTDGFVQTVDGTQVLSDTGATGAGTDSLSSIETATLNGGTGNDTIGATGFTGDLTVNTGNGDNLVNAGSGNDLVIGGLGRDTLNGGGGADTLFGSGGKDVLDGGLGDDVLKGQGATGDSLTGGAGNDFIDGGAGVDIVVESSTGDITLTDTQLFANGVDNLVNTEQADLTAGDGDDVIDVTAFTTSLGTFLYGGLGNDTIRGAEFRDVIFGLEGDDLLIGNGGDDDLMGSAGRDTMSGGAGNDRLRGQGGSGDVLIGGLGDDILDGGAGNDRLVETGDVDFVLTDTTLTGLGTDTIIATEFATLNGGSSGNTLDASGTTTLTATLNGLGGADTITGGSPSELITGGEGDDVINAGTGDDTIDGGSGDDMIDGQGGDDRLVVSADANLTTTDSQTTGNGTDSFSNIELVELIGGAGANRLDASGATLPTIQNGGAGSDTLVTGAGTDMLDGGDGTDVSSITGTNVVLTDASFNGTDTIVNVEIVNVTAGATASLLDASAYTLGSVNLIGGMANDTLLGGSGNDTLSGNEGDDSIVGGAGNDIATGGIGNDVITGGTGNDNLNGNGGNDLLSGEDDNDLARGGTGNDTILGGAGSDTLEGEDGNDSIRGGAANDTIDGGRNNDTIFGDDGDDSLIGGLGEDGISGGLGNDFALGDFGNDTITGGAGDDNLLGSAGNDIVIGGDGDDLVRGNGGDDTLAGNAGTDTFVGLNSEIDENFSEADFPFLL